MEGVIKWWIKEKGYGFIEYNDNQNIFAYLEENEKHEVLFEDNDKINFEIIKTIKGNHLILKGN